jgi:hypothetical protein
MDKCSPKYPSDSKPSKDIYSKTARIVFRTPSTLKHNLLDADGKVKLLKRPSKTTECSASHQRHPTRQLPGKPSTAPLPVLLVEPYSPILLDLLPTPYHGFYKMSLFTSPSLIYTLATVFIRFFSNTSYHHYLPASTFGKGAVVRETAAYKTWAGKQPTQVVYSQ